LNSLYSLYYNFTTKTGDRKNIIPTIFAMIPLRAKPVTSENSLWTLLLGLFTYDSPTAIHNMINKEIQQGKELFKTTPIPPEVNGLAETLKNALIKSLIPSMLPEGERTEGAEGAEERPEGERPEGERPEGIEERPEGTEGERTEARGRENRGKFNSRGLGGAQASPFS